MKREHRAIDFVAETLYDNDDSLVGRDPYKSSRKEWRRLSVLDKNKYRKRARIAIRSLLVFTLRELKIRL